MAAARPATAPVGPDLEACTAEEVLTHMVEHFHPRLYVACSFQKESSVVLDLLLNIEPEARVFTLDTDVLFEETYETHRAIEERYGIKVDVYRGPTLDEQAAEHGDALWSRNPDLCCAIRKVEPMRRALSEVDAWVAGLRREQSPSRRQASKLGWDRTHRVWKANPLADWTERDVWSYIVEHDLPYNPLHDQGYASIGCRPCTRPGTGREGRWAGRDKVECGIHDD